MTVMDIPAPNSRLVATAKRSMYNYFRQIMCSGQIVIFHSVLLLYERMEETPKDINKYVYTVE